MSDKHTIKTYRDLIAWQHSRELVRRVYQITATMPESEKFELTNQMRRAAVSIPSNIAEGYGRQTLPDYLRFLRHSRGSLMELETQLILTEDLELILVPEDLLQLLAETDRVLQGLIRSLESLLKK